MSTTLFYNGVFHSGLSKEDVFSCMTVKKGIITGVFSSRPSGRFAREIDLQGAHVYPCFIDTHIHMLFTIAVMAMGFDVCHITSNGVSPCTLAGVEKVIRQYTASKPADAVIAANNYILSAMDCRRLPTRQELDEWAGGRAIVIYNIDGHSTALSSAMLKKIGIDPEGHSGVLTGEENERAQGRLTDAISGSITLPILAKGIANFQNACAAYGISVVGALEGNGDSPKDLTTALLVHLAKYFEVGVRFYFQYFSIDRAKKLSKHQRRPRIGGCGDWETDGSVSSRSAAFPYPYLDTSSPAPCYYSDSVLEENILRADAAGYQIASHAIGESAIRQLSAALNKTSGKTLHRIEHCEFISEDTLASLDPAKYAVTMQPGYAWIDRHYLHSYEQALPCSVLENLKLKSIYEKMLLCGSSDSPVQAMDPFLQMLGMTDFYAPAESLGIFEAFRTYTLNPAQVLGEASERGTLEVGKMADFFTASQDLFSLSGPEIAAFRPESTYFGGKKYISKSGSVAELLLSLLRRPRKV